MRVERDAACAGSLPIWTGVQLWKEGKKTKKKWGGFSASLDVLSLGVMSHSGLLGLDVLLRVRVELHKAGNAARDVHAHTGQHVLLARVVGD